jgi:hypothetical protein
MPRLKTKLRRVLQPVFWITVIALLLGRSQTEPGDELELVRAYTRSLEFDFITWTMGAAWVKWEQASLGAATYLIEADRKQAVLDYLQLVRDIWRAEYDLNRLYADPEISDPETASIELRARIEALHARRELLGPLAESILQEQISLVVADLGLGFIGQPIPPVLYRTTPPPDALIVSRRDRIEQIHNISITPGLTADKQAALETQVDQARNVSSLVVPIGGIGLYPTMVMQTADMNWLAEVVAHEWIHNYLTLRPLGINYDANPEMRIINETTASIAGVEIGREVISRYYPELLPPPPAPPPSDTETPPAEPPVPPAFDFRAEMRETRLMVDQLLAEGKIEEAESYMEDRRQFFVENGYTIRKLNQAYFAFYGAYADQPGGAAGEDPISAAVRTLRKRSATITEFIQRIAWAASYDDLKQMVQP